MKNKYYIPSIEEFHVGFEYEVKLNNGNWENHQLINLHELSFESKSIEENNIRVKYLDKEDIENLGFVFSTTRKQYEKYSEDRNHRYEIRNSVLNIYSISFCNLTKEIHIPEHLFYGTVKNKAELKKLLTQLNIESTK